MKGIYKIVIGNKFYIGQAKRLAARMHGHEYGINGCSLRYGMPKQSEKYYLSFVRYLNENPMVVRGKVFLVQRCVSDIDLMVAENWWLRESKSNPDCLNVSFHCSRAYLRGDLWDIEVEDGWLIKYFDPTADPIVKYQMYHPLSPRGEILTQKQQEKQPEYIRLLQFLHGLDHTTA